MTGFTVDFYQRITNNTEPKRSLNQVHVMVCVLW